MAAGGRNVATNDLNFRKVLFDPANFVQYAFGMTMGRINDNDIDACGDERGNPLFCTCTCSNRSAYAQTSPDHLYTHSGNPGLLNIPG